MYLYSIFYSGTYKCFTSCTRAQRRTKGVWVPLLNTEGKQGRETPQNKSMAWLEIETSSPSSMLLPPHHTHTCTHLHTCTTLPRGAPSSKNLPLYPVSCTVPDTALCNVRAYSYKEFSPKRKPGSFLIGQLKASQTKYKYSPKEKFRTGSQMDFGLWFNGGLDFLQASSRGTHSYDIRVAFLVSGVMVQSNGL